MKKAFTLIELIFVIVVIGILSSFALPKLNDTREHAIINSVKQDIGSITTAIKSHYLIKGDITKISDAIKYNESLWSGSDLFIEYKISSNSCVSIEVDKSSTVMLNITITPSSHSLCQKLANLGVSSTKEELY
ncbi:MAG: hypothetical protein B1H07_01135 [Campylobacteraceae bacterium 4484_166]|nr:MAG: hypothetical protein B1H07_01135 [Campylobacteraceae bacterium 4484_166]